MLTQGLTILLYMVAFATGCMTLILSVVYHVRENIEWTKFFIIFHISLLLLMVLQVMKVFVSLFFGPTVAMVTGIVIQGLLAANVSFLIVFIPYFSSLNIAKPWRNPFIFIFFFLASAYMALSILDIIFKGVWAFQASMMIIFIFTLFFSIADLMKNLKTIDDSGVRLVSKAIIILSFVMMPLLVINVIFPAYRHISYPIYFTAFSIIILVYLINYFTRTSLPKEEEISFESASRFNISQREFSVIKLIEAGMTNKEIGDELSISVNTVNNHIANIFSKTQVRSRIDLLNILKEV
ncbi:MAG: helix-turn-helix transcriptional regulator [Sphaerochaetaceae bacterium]